MWIDNLLNVLSHRMGMLVPYVVIDYILLFISLPFAYRKIKLLKQAIPQLTDTDMLHWQSYKRKIRTALILMIFPFLIFMVLIIAGEWVPSFYKIIARLFIIISFIVYFLFILYYKPRIFDDYLSNNQKQQWTTISRTIMLLNGLLWISLLMTLLIL
ncbi:SoxR reducing system RseC family protein [Holzapfeliella floricola]|uniref:SoxR reducing system RseC family protein n=1 Tax=Holzapfeliella floricola TaxID=679249 RepID=UPI0007054DF2|nr:SoxR reducing system RseC family protein [Holzapfeliella floricola]